MLLLLKSKKKISILLVMYPAICVLLRVCLELSGAGSGWDLPSFLY